MKTISRVAIRNRKTINSAVNSGTTVIGVKESNAVLSKESVTVIVTVKVPV